MIACSNDTIFVAPSSEPHFELVHGDATPAGPGDDADLALLGETGKAAGEARLTTPSFQPRSLPRSIEGSANRDAVGAPCRGFRR